jgi:hypothetical protein
VLGQQADPIPPLTQVESAPTSAHQPLPQPKRILGVAPNYRAVSPSVIPPPPTPKEAFKIATENSFDYTAFLFDGITTLIGEERHSHRQLGSGASGFGRYYWRSFADRTANNYVVMFALPSVFHEDERYYAKGEGGRWRRIVYAASRVLIIPDYHENNSINASEVLGRGITQAISTTYYPSRDRTAGRAAIRYGVSLGHDAITNIFREFWPDISAHVFHRKP